MSTGTQPKVPAPTSIDEMHDMPAGDFHRVGRYQWGDSASVSRVIDHLIDLADDELQWRGETDANSLRDFWYNPTKPIVEPVFPDSKTDLDSRLSERMSKAVKEGRVTYRGLNILDDSRERDIYSSSAESDRILFVEKNSTYRKLKPLAEVYEMTLVSGGGQAALAMIEDLVRHLDGFGGDSNDGYEVFVLSDYDPSGYSIWQSFVDRCKTLGLPITSVERIGLSPEQLTDEQIDRQRFSPPDQDSDDREWLADHGIEGRYGLELEAIGDRNKKGEAIRRLVVEEIGDRIRTDERAERDHDNAMGGVANAAAGDVADRIASDLRERLTDEAEDILATKSYSPDGYSPDDLHESAIEGKRPIVSTASVRSSVKDELRDRIDTGEIPADELLEMGGQA